MIPRSRHDSVQKQVRRHPVSPALASNRCRGGRNRVSGAARPTTFLGSVELTLACSRVQSDTHWGIVQRQDSGLWSRGQRFESSSPSQIASLPQAPLPCQGEGGVRVDCLKGMRIALGCTVPAPVLARQNAQSRHSMDIDKKISPSGLLSHLMRFWQLSGAKILLLHDAWSDSPGAPVFTVRGRYTARGWTDWTQGFRFGSALLQYDATGDERFLELGRQGTLASMPRHLTHMGVHDHGFSAVSTYGNLWRLHREGRLPPDLGEQRLCELALAVSGAVQARRWTAMPDGGFIYSFNGPHSLFVDTLRSLRVLALAHHLGHVLLEERDREVSLLGRLIAHADCTARYLIYYGEGRDCYDVPGRVAHEALFDVLDGSYRCPSTQQGYSPFTTWMRGLGWALLGFAELLEFVDLLDDAELEPWGGRRGLSERWLRAARATADYYIANTPADGIPYWDTGAPGLQHLGNYLERPADPFNQHEPVDSSAAAIVAQGLLRLGRCLASSSEGQKYTQAGLTVLRALLSEPYLAVDHQHQGLILHAVYHRPNGWDYVPPGANIPRGEAVLWGDYHAREAALYVQRLARGEPYLAFFGPSRVVTIGEPA